MKLQDPMKTVKALVGDDVSSRATAAAASRGTLGSDAARHFHAGPLSQGRRAAQGAKLHLLRQHGTVQADTSNCRRSSPVAPAACMGLSRYGDDLKTACWRRTTSWSKWPTRFWARNGCQSMWQGQPGALSGCWFNKLWMSNMDGSASGEVGAGPCGAATGAVGRAGDAVAHTGRTVPAVPRRRWSAGGQLDACRVVRAGEPGFPASYRVVLTDHVAEWSDVHIADQN